MNKDLYSILGLSKDASDSDIKRSYRKLALKYHPDRQGDKSDKEKKEAEEKFKDISFAYSILSDPQKKQKYDQFGITDDQQIGGDGFDPSDIFNSFMGGFGSMFNGDDPFSAFFGGSGNKQRRQRRQPQNGQSIRMQVPVSIDEILTGVNRDIKYDIKVRCSKCHGAGGEGVETCPHCKGTGMITETSRHGFSIIQNSHPCQYCGGTGEVIKNKCSECSGTGFKTKEVSLRINCGGGFENHHKMMFTGKGYEAKDPSNKNGDLLIELVYDIDTSKFNISDNNIYELVDIPYYDCILGNKLNHTLPNGEKIDINIPPYTQDKNIISISKKFGKMNYSIVVNVKLPTYVRKSEIELLEKIRNENL